MSTLPHVYRTLPCVHCHQSTDIIIPKDEIMRWQNGELAQNVWPDMSPDAVELIISGTHPQCWDEVFGGDPDEAE